MSDLNTSWDRLTSNDSFIIKTSQSPTYKYLTYAGFQNEVQLGILAQEVIQSKNANPLTVDSFEVIEALVFLDFVSASNTLTINLPAGLFSGQKVSVSINVLSGTALTTIVVKDDQGNTLFTINPAVTTLQFIVDQDMVWKRL